MPDFLPCTPTIREDRQFQRENPHLFSQQVRFSPRDRSTLINREIAMIDWTRRMGLRGEYRRQVLVWWRYLVTSRNSIAKLSATRQIMRLLRMSREAAAAGGASPENLRSRRRPFGST